MILPIALPNIVWALLEARSKAPSPLPSPSGEARVLVLIESLGRVAIFILPLLFDVRVRSQQDRAFVALGVLSLAVYYAAWARYFSHGRAAGLLFASMGGLPVPLAIAPVVYYLAFAGLIRSPGLAVVAAAFGVAHIALSLRRSRAA